MASENVDKLIKTLQDDPVLAAELSLALAKLKAAAGVTLTKEDKKEFFLQLADFASKEVLIIIWF
jgi:hypothetical protein